MAKDNITAAPAVPALCVKLIVSDKQTRLKHELIDKLMMILRIMNPKFMIYCRGKNVSIGKVKKVQNVLGNAGDIFEDDDE
jgi:hypothetical protein